MRREPIGATRLLRAYACDTARPLLPGLGLRTLCNTARAALPPAPPGMSPETPSLLAATAAHPAMGHAGVSALMLRREHAPGVVPHPLMVASGGRPQPLMHGPIALA